MTFSLTTYGDDIIADRSHCVAKPVDFFNESHYADFRYKFDIPAERKSDESLSEMDSIHGSENSRLTSVAGYVCPFPNRDTSA